VPEGPRLYLGRVSSERILVLGAGSQGTLVALMLEQRGHSVTLIDKAPAPLLRAGLRNEGKIHLGFIFANDPSFETPLLMLRSALAFASAVEECVGRPIDWDTCVSRPFTYVIAQDSMVAPDTLADRYQRLQDAYADAIRDRSASYLGRRPHCLWRPGSARSVGGHLADGSAAGVVDTVEVALDLNEFRRILCASLEERIEMLPGHSVDSVVRTPGGFRVSGVTVDGEAWQREAGVVLNCLWDGRLKLDRELGLVPTRRWVYRLKYRLLGSLPPALHNLPSLSVVLGPYGDVGVYPRNRIYLSWYPVCQQGWNADLAPPAAWDAPCDGRVDAEHAADLKRRALEGFGRLIPGLGDTDVDTVDAGVIFSWGETDIQDPDSELHRRCDVGINQHDGYFSVDPGKITCAPLFARQLAALVGEA
jgi:glycine/D-amino acid oxidase-like deaminating enzyme